MKIKLITTQPHGACSYYRSLGVFQKIKDLQIDSTGEFDWYNINDVDCVFFERPITPNHLLAIKYAKDYGVKTWVDYDDNLLEIPTWNPMFSYLTNKTTQDTIIKCLEYADIVTVPTVALKEQFQKFNKNIEIIPNAFNDYNFNLEYKPSKNQKILWRGSITHRKDILYYQKMLVDTAAANKEWEWNFIGKDIWYITEVIANRREHPELNIIPYFNRIKSINPAIYIVPLYPCAFNEAKSNCGWLEATYAGACTIAPKTAEWIRPGIINYESREDFGVKLQTLISDPEKREKNYKASYEYIKANLQLSKVNKQRSYILENIQDYESPQHEPDTKKYNFDLSKCFIALYTNECKSYCDDQFYGTLLTSNVDEAEICLVDNTQKVDYIEKLKSKYGSRINCFHIDVSREDEKTLFLRNVTDSLTLLRDEFLKTDCEYFITLETDVIPREKNWLNYFMEVVDKADIIGGLYYNGFRGQEALFDNTNNNLIPIDHVLSGCALYKREVIEKIPFRWSTDNLGAFPDAWICYDSNRNGNSFKLANYNKIKCDHIEHGADRGHNNIL
jgi:hypothetical protein